MKPILETFCIAYYLTGIQRFRFILYKNLTIRIYIRACIEEWKFSVDRNHRRGEKQEEYNLRPRF